MFTRPASFLLILCVTLHSLCEASPDEDQGSDFAGFCPLPVGALVNDLARNVSRGMLKGSGNVFFSPFGIQLALGMLYAAATGDTAVQIEEFMGFKSLGQTGQEIHDNLHELLSSALSANNTRHHDVLIKNALFLHEDVTIADTFPEAFRYYYHADTERLDFNKSQTVMDSINDWFGNRTMGNSEVAPFLSEQLPPESRMVLTSAVHFKGIWKIEFPSGRTTRDYFYTGRRQTKEVQMMSLFMETFNYYEDLELKYKFVELPYKGDGFSMILSLPLQYDQPADLVLDAASLCNVTRKLRSTQLELVALPPFRFESPRHLRRELTAAGLRHPFVAEAAELFGAPGLAAADLMTLGSVEVAEAGGSEAAVLDEESVEMPVAFREVTEFVANHPFVFYVVDRGSGVALFVGRVDEPAGYPVAESLQF